MMLIFAVMVRRRMKAYDRDIALPEGVFSRADLLYAASSQLGLRETQLRNLLAALLDSGRISRVGRGRYVASPASKPAYVGPYGDESREMAISIHDAFPLLDMRVWELGWLNEFVGHQIARSCVFAEVESVGTESVFEELDSSFGGRVLLSPSAEEYLRYGRDGCVVVGRLVSEAPCPGPESWSVGLEKLSVDLVANKLVSSIVSGHDRMLALAEMFSTYAIDQVAMMRYARRRGREPELRRVLAEAGVELYV